MDANNVGKRKSRFRKAPQAPKRFKSEMMQQMKNDQRSKNGKSKITDISKHISFEWKNLSTDEKGKWEEISNEDKKRFLAEKQSYQGPWQIKNEENRGRSDSASSALSPETYSLLSEAELSSEEILETHDISELDKEAAENLMNLLLNKSHTSSPRSEVILKDANEVSDNMVETSICEVHVPAPDKANMSSTDQSKFVKESRSLPVPSSQGYLEFPKQQMMMSNHYPPTQYPQVPWFSNYYPPSAAHFRRNHIPESYARGFYVNGRYY